MPRCSLIPVKRDRQRKSVATTLLMATLLWLPGCMTQRVVHQATCGEVQPVIDLPTQALE